MREVLSGHGRVVDALDRGIEHPIEIGLALLGGQPFGESPGEARNDPVIPPQAGIAFRLGVTTR